MGPGGQITCKLNDSLSPTPDQQTKVKQRKPQEKNHPHSEESMSQGRNGEACVLALEVMAAPVSPLEDSPLSTVFI